MKKVILNSMTAFLLLSYTATSQTLPQALAKIHTEGFQKSQVMNLITDVSDVYGPLLKGTNIFCENPRDLREIFLNND